jgi:hypothetical protein
MEMAKAHFGLGSRGRADPDPTSGAKMVPY